MNVFVNFVNKKSVIEKKKKKKTVRKKRLPCRNKYSLEYEIPKKKKKKNHCWVHVELS